MPLYTEEQLSMILSAHAAGRLIKGGALSSQACDGYGCINQIAFQEPNPSAAMYGQGAKAERVAEWFDGHYSPDMPASLLLRRLESF